MTNSKRLPHPFFCVQLMRNFITPTPTRCLCLRSGAVVAGAMSSYCMPMVIINMGGEMVYILEQRLHAQNVPLDKSKRGAPVRAS